MSATLESVGNGNECPGSRKCPSRDNHIHCASLNCIMLAEEKVWNEAKGFEDISYHNAIACENCSDLICNMAGCAHVDGFNRKLCLGCYTDVRNKIDLESITESNLQNALKDLDDARLRLPQERDGETLKRLLSLAERVKFQALACVSDLMVLARDAAA